MLSESEDRKKAKFDELSASDLSTIDETLALYDGIGDYDSKDGIVPVVAARDFISDVIDKNPPKCVIDAGEQLDLKLFIRSRLEATKNSNLIETSENLQSALNYLKAKEEGLTKD